MTRNPTTDYRRQRLEQTAVGQVVTMEEMELLFGAPIPGYGRLVGGTIRFQLPQPLLMKEFLAEIPPQVLEVVFQTERYVPPNYADPEAWPEPCRLLRWRRVR